VVKESLLTEEARRKECSLIVTPTHLESIVTKSQEEVKLGIFISITNMRVASSIEPKTNFHVIIVVRWDT